MGYTTSVIFGWHLDSHLQYILKICHATYHFPLLHNGKSSIFVHYHYAFIQASILLSLVLHFLGEQFELDFILTPLQVTTCRNHISHLHCYYFSTSYCGFSNDIMAWHRFKVHCCISWMPFGAEFEPSKLDMNTWASAKLEANGTLLGPKPHPIKPSTYGDALVGTDGVASYGGSEDYRLLTGVDGNY